MRGRHVSVEADDVVDDVEEVDDEDDETDEDIVEPDITVDGGLLLVLPFGGISSSDAAASYDFITPPPE